MRAVGFRLLAAALLAAPLGACGADIAGGIEVDRISATNVRLLCCGDRTFFVGRTPDFAADLTFYDEGGGVLGKMPVTIRARHLGAAVETGGKVRDVNFSFGSYRNKRIRHLIGTYEGLTFGVGVPTIFKSASLVNFSGVGLSASYVKRGSAGVNFSFTQVTVLRDGDGDFDWNTPLNSDALLYLP